MDQQLYEIVDFILNQAGEREIEVIKAALKRRQEGSNSPAAFNPSTTARELSSRIDEQVKRSLDSVKGSVMSYVTALIKKEVPDIPDEHLKVLIEAWVPDTSGEEKKGRSAPPGQEVPAEFLLTMISQFIAFGTGSMPIQEQARLEEEIPGWQKKFWASFPQGVRNAVSSYLKGEIDSASCWHRIKSELS